MTVADALLGYEYQINVSVWLILDVLLARRLADKLDIEPRDTQEDVKVALDERANGHMTVGLTRTWQIQIKLRSAPWTPTSLADLVFGEDERAAALKRRKQREKREKVDARPARHALGRAPPAELLMNADSRYLLITSAQAPTISAHIVQAVGAEAAKPLPGEPLSETLAEEQVAGCYVGLTAEALAGRIAVMEQVTPRLLELLIPDLLRKVGHVPAHRREACKTALVDEVRSRMLGDTTPVGLAGVVAILERHEGRQRPDPELACFEAPEGFDAMCERMEQVHAVLLVGEPGVGKTTCAVALCEGLRQTTPANAEPFRVVRVSGAHQLHVLRERQQGPVVFHVEDPWGRFSTDKGYLDAHELLEQLRSARADRRFVITTPYGIFRHAVGDSDAGKSLTPYVLHLRPASNDVTRRKRIVARMLGHLTGPPLRWTERNGDALAQELRLPLELFVATRDLERRWRADPDADPDVGVVVAESRREAMTGRLVKELTDRSPKTSVEAAVLLAALAADGALRADTVREASDALLEDTALRDFDPGALLHWLKARGSLRRRDDGWGLHPLHIAALEEVATRGGGSLLRLDRYVGRILGVLLKAGHERMATALWTSSAKESPLAQQVRGQLLDLVRLDLARAGGRSAFLDSAHVLGERGDTGHPVEMLLAALLFEGTKVGRKGFASTMSFDSKWVAPEWTRDDYERVRTSGIARQVAEAFFRHLFGHHGAAPINFRRMSGFLEDIGWDLSPVFLEVIDRAIEPSCVGADVIVSGAVSGATPPWDGLTDRFLDALKEIDEEWAREWELWLADTQDATWLEYASDHAVEFGYAAQSALNVLVAERRRRAKSWAFLRERELTAHLKHAWANSFQLYPGDEAEAEALLATCLPHAPSEVWAALVQWPMRPLVPSLLGHLVQAQGEDAGGILATLRATLLRDDLERILAPTLAAMSQPRRVEAIDAARHARTSGDREHHYELGPVFASIDSEAADLAALLRDDDEDVKAKPVQLAALKDVLANGSAPLAARAFRLLRRSGVVVAVPDRLITQSDDDARVYVAETVVSAPIAGDRELLRDRMLRDGCWRVRKRAVGFLGVGPTDADRAALLALLPTEKSTHVRLSLVQVAEQNRWEEAQPWLVECLRDQVNWNEDPYHGHEDPDYRVATAAANAIGVFDAPPEFVVAELETFLRDGPEANPIREIHDAVRRILGSRAPPSTAASPADLGAPKPGNA